MQGKITYYYYDLSEVQSRGRGELRGSETESRAGGDESYEKDGW